MRRKSAVFVFCVLFGQFAMSQATPHPITNSDIISMTGAGIGQQTIILAIQRGPDKFDTSPQELITLKKAGVSDQVLNAMLAAGSGEIKASSVQQPAPVQKPIASGSPSDSTDATRAASFKHGCDSGDMDACVNLGVYYRMGWGVTEDKARASALFKKACDEGSTAGCRMVGGATSSESPSRQNAILAASMNQGLTLRVLQEQSVPYTQESGGGISTTCNITGTANTSAYTTAYGNSAYGNATTASNQYMRCSSYDTTMRWPHVLNVMFVHASDGNSYIIACDRAWRWSKCNPLQAGEVFSARFTSKGIDVQAISSKGKEENITYKVLQSRAWR